MRELPPILDVERELAVFRQDVAELRRFVEEIKTEVTPPPGRRTVVEPAPLPRS